MTGVTEADAIRELEACGVENAESLLDFGMPEQLVGACERWRAQTNRPGKGLLVRWIRDGDFPEYPAAPVAGDWKAIMRARFDQWIADHPEGSVFESHRDRTAKQWPDDIERAKELGGDACDGQLVVIDAYFPTVTVECDVCGFELALPARAFLTAEEQAAINAQKRTKGLDASPPSTGVLRHD